MRAKCRTGSEEFAKRLAKLMADSGTTQKQLSDVVGMRPQTVSLYLLGHNVPDINCVRNVANYFGVSADWLMGLSEKKQHDISISKYTGLTESSIEAIRKLDKDALAGLNAFLGCLLNEKSV